MSQKKKCLEALSPVCQKCYCRISIAEEKILVVSNKGMERNFFHANHKPTDRRLRFVCKAEKIVIDGKKFLNVFLYLA